MSREDFTTMYVKYPMGEITLWCDGHSDKTGDTGSRKKRKKDGETSTRRQEKEDEVIHAAERKHGQKFDIPRLRLWTHTICGNLHDDFENPPDLPAFCNETPKKG